MTADFVQTPNGPQCAEHFTAVVLSAMVRARDADIQQLRRELADCERAIAVRQMCEWQEDSDDYEGTYATSCGKAFEFNEGTVSENGVRFCPFCGGFIREPKNAGR